MRCPLTGHCKRRAFTASSALPAPARRPPTAPQGKGGCPQIIEAFPRAEMQVFHIQAFPYRGLRRFGAQNCRLSLHGTFQAAQRRSDTPSNKSPPCAVLVPNKSVPTYEPANLPPYAFWCRPKAFRCASPQTSAMCFIGAEQKCSSARARKPPFMALFEAQSKVSPPAGGNGRTEVGYSQTEAGISARRRERLDRNGTAGQGVCAWGCAQALVYTIWVLWEAFAQRRKRPAACHQVTDATPTARKRMRPGWA